MMCLMTGWPKNVCSTFLSDELLLSLQYSAVDTNPLSVYVMHPFWNFVVKVSKTCLALSLDCT